MDVPAATARGYRWRWQTVEGETVSPDTFDFFYECMSDAREHGYQVELRAAPALMRSAWSLGTS